MAGDPYLAARLARMQPAERAIIQRFADAMRRRDIAAARAALAPALPDLIAARGSDTFIGCAFDRWCALEFRRSPRADAIAAVGQLCDAAEAASGPRAWSALYRGALRHLAGAHDEAVPHYRRAAVETGHLWRISQGCGGVITLAAARAAMRAPPWSGAAIAIHRLAPPRDAVALVSADSVYLRAYAPGFITALAAHAPQVTPHIHLVDPQRGDLDWIDRELPGANVSTERHDRHGDRGFYALARLLHAHHLLDLYDRPLLVSDVDAAYRAPIDPAHPAFDADVALWIQHDGFFHQPWLAIQAGLLWLAPSDAGRGFARALSALGGAMVAGCGGGDLWYADQNALQRLHLLRDELATPVRIADLGTLGMPGRLAFGKWVHPSGENGSSAR